MPEQQGFLRGDPPPGSSLGPLVIEGGASSAGLTDEQLRASSLDVSDTYTTGQALASQPGDGSVKTFTFAAPMDLIWVRCQDATGFADPFGGTPASGQGIFCEDGIPQPITLRTTTVKVWAPAGTIHVWGYGA